MSEAVAAAPARQAAEPGAKPELRLQRKCACGQHTVDGSECEECRKKRLTTQRWSTARPRPDALARTSDARLRGSDLSTIRAQTPLLRTAPRLQRMPDEGSSAEAPIATAESIEASTPETETASSTDPSSSPERAAPEPAGERGDGETSPESQSSRPGATLLAEDDAADIAAGQMRKTEFLDQLQRAVCAEADQALAAAGRSTEGCPYIAQAFGRYRGQSAAQVESGLRRYAPETRNARTAAETIPILAARVRQGVERWVATGEISGVPDDAPISIPTGGLGGVLGGVARGIGSLLFKADEGGARPADDPATVHAELGDGQAMESGVRGRMERAFGRSFGGVRMHTDATAGRLTAEQNARAFAVGGHVAFAAGEYRPGTPAGDALIAHELAHTVQQGGGSSSVQAKASSSAGYDALETDADRSAASVVASLWGGAREKAREIARGAAPALRSGLSLQRCPGNRRTTTPSTTTSPPSTGPATAPGTAPATGPASAATTSSCLRLVSLTTHVISPTIGVTRNGGCRLETGQCPTPRGSCGGSGTSGATTTAIVEAPAGCAGELAFAQNVLSSDRRRTLSTGANECIRTTSPYSDGGRPWKGCVLPVTAPGTYTITTDDCPYVVLTDDMTAAHVADSFKTFLTWKPAGASSRSSIANVTWAWASDTTRQPGTGTTCASRWAAPTGTPTDGTGSASTDNPVTSPSIQDVRWGPCS